MKELFIDIETFSDVDLTKSGVYKYVDSDRFQILLFAYSVDKGPVKVIDLASGEKMPEEILKAIVGSTVKKYAYNAQFERVCLSKFLGYPVGSYLDPSSWYCDMVWAATLGLPIGLEKLGIVLDLDKQKLSAGKDLIRYFCKAHEPDIETGEIQKKPSDDPERWELFKEYNKRDVETEMEIHERIAKFPVLESEWDAYHLDQRINDYGIKLDMDLVEHAIHMDLVNSEENTNKAKEITGVDNPQSVKQLKEWLLEQGTVTESLSKSDIVKLLDDTTGNVHEILKLRQELAKSSVKKYQAMENAVCSDDRARGLIQFYGANRTGRFAGRLIQVQNLPQNHIENLDYARNLVKEEDFAGVLDKYGNLPNTLSELIRTAFIPKDGCRFIVCDFSAIEARVIAWYAKEDWRLQAFENGEDIYCASASKMFHVKVEKHGENSELRPKGKIAELALGYGGSIGALKAMGAVAMGISEDELPGIVSAWRNANPHITKFWWDIDKAVKYVIETRKPYKCYGLSISYEKGVLFIKLPSGRSLAYCKPRKGINNFGSVSITYEGVGTNKNWERIESYGPKVVENIVQATARDLLVEALKRLDKAGYKITMHIHDEAVLEVPYGKSSVGEVAQIMCELPEWAKGMPLNADGYECEFYKKE